MARTKLLGDKKIRRMLRYAPDDISKPVKDSFERGAIKMLNVMKRRAPTRTGALRNALDYKTSSDGLSVKIGLRGKRKNRRYFYGHILNTSKYKSGRFQFLDPTFEEVAPKMLVEIQSKIDQALEKLATR